MIRKLRRRKTKKEREEQGKDKVDGSEKGIKNKIELRRFKR
jgi:hypothetical protein